MINRRFAGGPGTKSYHETRTPISEVEVRRVKRTTFARGEPRALGPDRPLVPVDKTNEILLRCMCPRLAREPYSPSRGFG